MRHVPNETPEDENAIREAEAILLAAAPQTEAEWLAVHDEVHRVADQAPHPRVVFARIAEALINLRPPGPTETSCAPTASF